MPAKRLTMRKTREILRLKWSLELSHRQVAASLHISPSTVADCELRAQSAGLSWPLDEALDDAQLEALLYPPPEGKRDRPGPDFARIYRELKRKGVTLALLWQEYKAQYPDGYQYSRYCDHYRSWREKLDVVMRQEYRAGEKMFVDYAGPTMAILDPSTGEVREAAIFVAALGASNYTYAEAQPSQALEPWVMGHIRALEFFGGVPEVWVPDNLKSGVKEACFYEPDLNPTYGELAEYYGAAVIPARKRRPRDKAKVENAVLQVERWVLAPLRDHEFNSLGELNRALRRKLDELNDRPLTELAGSRRSLYLELDRPALQPLPAKRYEIAEWKTHVAVGIDYHVVFEKHYYSVPHALVRERVDVRATWSTVEILFKGRRVASHRRSGEPGKFTTEPAHRPKSHQRSDWTPERLIRWASKTGPQTAKLVQAILEKRPHPEQGFRSCLGLLRLGKQHGAERLEQASSRALELRSFSYRSVASLLKHGLEQPAAALTGGGELALDHDNIRGSDYYH